MLLLVLFIATAFGAAVPLSSAAGFPSSIQQTANTNINSATVDITSFCGATTSDTDGVYYGCGNPNGNFVRSIAVFGAFTVELGLRITRRFPPGATATAQYGASVELPTGRAIKYDWSVRILAPQGGQTLGSLISAGARFEFAIDTDSSDGGANFVAFDPLSFGSRPGNEGIFAVDHSFLTTSETLRQDGNAGTFSTLLNAATGAQNAGTPYFLRDSPAVLARLQSSDPSQPTSATFPAGALTVFPDGRYETFLRMADSSGAELARSSISIFQGTSSMNGALGPDQFVQIGNE